MSAVPRGRRRSTAAAIAVTAAVTASAALLLSACGPEDATDATDGTSPTASGPATTGSASTGGSGSGSGKGTSDSGGSPAPVNGTAHNGLTISDGTRYVVMNGTRVDFGTEVRDLAWSRDGGKAAFVDGDGDLAVSNADGSGRVIAARNPGGQNWSHPTWLLRADDPVNGEPGADRIVFAVRSGSTSRLVSVDASAHDATPQPLSLNHVSGEDVPDLPQTGNVWPNAGGRHGTSVYANQATGDVYIRDDYLRQQGFDLAKGSEPALGPDDGGDNGEIVFVRSVGGHDHLFVEHSGANGPTYKDITPNATTDYTEPAWSPDGRTIAARTPQGVVTLAADGSQPPVPTSGYHGLPAYRAS